MNLMNSTYKQYVIRQNNATYHTAAIKINFLKEQFGGHLMSRKDPVN